MYMIHVYNCIIMLNLTKGGLFLNFKTLIPWVIYTNNILLIYCFIKVQFTFTILINPSFTLVQIYNMNNFCRK